MRGQAAGPQGFGGLGAILGQLGGGGLLSNVLGTDRPTSTRATRCSDRSSATRTPAAVAADAAQKSGVSADLLKKMLPIVAMLVAGYLAKQHGSAGAAGPRTPRPPRTAGSWARSSAARGAGGGILGSILGGLTRR